MSIEAIVLGQDPTRTGKLATRRLQRIGACKAPTIYRTVILSRDYLELSG
jgi:hypothetical protein